MIQGPALIRRCSACRKLIAQHTIISGNTFGARFWTDGKMDAPMEPDEPWLVKCQHCGALLWIDEQKQIGKVQPWELGGRDEANFKEARPYVTPSAQDYFAILTKGVADGRKVRYLRVRAWWAGNDERRARADATPLSPDEVANLCALAALLDEADEEDRIMKAEVMREMGKYEEAMALLSKPFCDELARAVTVVKNLTAQKVPFVREICSV